ncbi:MAG: site-specific integrase [bacterium]
MGSIIKRGTTYYMRFEGPPNADGSRKQVIKSCGIGTSKRQAEQLLRDAESQVNRQEYHHPTNLTLAEYLNDWLVRIRFTIAESTHANYVILTHAHIIPALGKKKLDKLTSSDIERFYARLQDAGSNRVARGRGLSPKSIKNIHGVLHKALLKAVKDGYIPRNPASTEFVDLPRQTRARISSATPVELQRLIADTKITSEWRMPILLAIGTGMRRGEVLGLQWQDYDPIQRTLTVQRALSQITTDNIIVKGTKTDRDRVIKLNPSLAEEIERHHAQTPFNQPTDWICACADGSHHVPRLFTRCFERLMRNLGIGISLHGLRHSHATALIAAGVPINAVSEWLGHSETSTTMNIYVHCSPAMQQQAADETEALWRRA